MPYIEKKQRQYFNIPVEVLLSITTPGQLNYIFTQLILAYLKNQGQSYQTYNDAMGALECCQFELYRRKIAGYEEQKIASNGDVF